MTESRIHRLWAAVVHILEHALAVTIGFAVVILGLALTFTIVFAIPGIIVLCLGVCLVVGGLFAHAMRRGRIGG